MTEAEAGQRRQIYLDYAATTPTDPRVVEAMAAYYTAHYGNPSSLHRMGQQARQALDAARATFAAGLGCQPHEIIFTGSGSEADNLALLGVAQARRDAGRHIITSSIEHHAILETCVYLESWGFEVTYLPVDQYGMVQPDDLQRALRPDTILVSIMHANNEIGTIQPIRELVRIAHEGGALFHTDAVQTTGQLRVDVGELGVDLLTLSAHKFYGPKGVGALVVREGVQLVPLIHGGAQERHRRAGTENVPGIAGAARAFELVLEHLDTEAVRLRTLRDDLWQRVAAFGLEVRLNGHPVERLPNNLSVSFKNVEAEGLLLRLSMAGIAASMGSACNSESIEPSHVIRALGLAPEWERGALRLTLGCHTDEDDVACAADSLIQIAAEMQLQQTP
jgi:cysteine desulfurase